MMDFTVERLGSIDILVNSAGITKDGLLIRMEEAEYDEVVQINQKGVYNCMRAAAYPTIKQRTGTIINIASMVGATGNKGQINYVVSKAAVLGMTKASALELASRGIRVNAVALGFIDTEMTQKLSSQLTMIVEGSSWQYTFTYKSE